jgi:propionate catabolism operon transcriptional regulator
LSWDGSQRTRVLIVGYRSFSELLNAVVGEFDDEAEVKIVESVARPDSEYHSLIARLAPDVVASAGSNAAYLASTLSVPVVSQPVTDTDIIEALSRARRLGSRIHLFLYQPENAPPPRLLASLPGLLDGALGYDQYSTSAQARELLRLALAEDRPEVVVGPSYICHLAEQEGLQSILVYSLESARVMLRAAIDRGRSQAALRRGEEEAPGRPEFVIRSRSMAWVAELARTYARGTAAVLIQGESGTGKEHIARELHRLGDFSGGELVAVNCGSIPNELFESELFGYAEGAFTGSRRGGRIGLVERANGGVLYLDEIGEMPPAQQVKLLRVLQDKRLRPLGSNREVSLDFKLIAATNRDLREAVARGGFRDDLYYRLNVFALNLPPLRERPEDIEAIARYYLREYGARYGVQVDMEQIYHSVARAFEDYHWPGNVRELQNFAERLVVNAGAGSRTEIDPHQLAQILPELRQRATPGSGAGSLRDCEEQAIRSAMQRFGGERARVAEFLGISTTTLWRRLRAMNAGTDTTMDMQSIRNPNR